MSSPICAKIEVSPVRQGRFWLVTCYTPAGQMIGGQDSFPKRDQAESLARIYQRDFQLRQGNQVELILRPAPLHFG